MHVLKERKRRLTAWLLSALQAAAGEEIIQAGEAPDTALVLAETEYAPFPEEGEESALFEPGVSDPAFADETLPEEKDEVLIAEETESLTEAAGSDGEGLIEEIALQEAPEMADPETESGCLGQSHICRCGERGRSGSG